MLESPEKACFPRTFILTCNENDTETSDNAVCNQFSWQKVVLALHGATPMPIKQKGGT
jgi:hypothetical protein